MFKRSQTQLMALVLTQRPCALTSFALGAYLSLSIADRSFEIDVFYSVDASMVSLLPYLEVNKFDSPDYNIIQAIIIK